MMSKIIPFKFKLSWFRNDLDPSSEEMGKANFESREVEWGKKDLLALTHWPQISHNLYENWDCDYGDWNGMQSVIFDLASPEPHEFNNLVVEIADHLECDICAYGIGKGMRVIVPFDRMVDDPDDRDGIRADLMSRSNLDLIEDFNLQTTSVQSSPDSRRFFFTVNHGPMKVDEVLARTPKPRREIVLPLSTEVETLEGKKLTFETLKPGTKFICPVCQDHTFLAPEGMNIIEHGWHSDLGYPSYFCAWCQVLRNNRTGRIEVEALHKPVATDK